MSTLMSFIQGRFTPQLQLHGCLNSKGTKAISILNPQLRSLSLCFAVSFKYQDPYEVNNHQFLKTGSGSYSRNQYLKPLAALVTSTTTSTTTTATSDLCVTLRSSSLVVPWEEMERRSMFLSNIDQSVNICIGGVFFFPANPDFPPEVVVKRLEEAYRKVLVHYDFLAGRLRLNNQQGRLEVDCNSSGAGFVVASSELLMSEIGYNLDCPNRSNEELVRRKWDSLGSNQPLFTLQVTTFKCGGSSLGITLNHAMLDGIGIQNFTENLASIASNLNTRESVLPFPPWNDRCLLAGRTPPCVSFPHPELAKIEDVSVFVGHDEPSFAPTPFQTFTNNLELKNFRLSAQDIANLKNKAKMGLSTKTGLSDDSTTITTTSMHNNGITSFNVVSAHIWRCMALAKQDERSKKNPKKNCTILFPINIRSRLRPRLLASYSGNALISGYEAASYREFEERPFLYFVQKLADGAKRVSDEYVRSVIDWGEINKGFAHGDIMLSSCWRLGLYSPEFPWGRAKNLVPLVHQWSNLVLLLQDSGDLKSNGAVNVFVALPQKELQKFQAHFHNHLYITN